MRAIRIRYNKANGGGKTTQRILESLCEDIVQATSAKGFNTKAKVINESSISISIGSWACFTINPAKLGYNARFGLYVPKGSKGYKRSTVPIWEQREDFNHIVNRVFDKHQLEASIKSGPYVVRTITEGAIKFWNCVTGEPDAVYNGMGMEVRRIVRERDIEEYVDVAKYKAEHKVRAMELAKQAKALRDARKAELEAANYVHIARVYSHKYRRYEGKQLTQASYQRLLKRLNKKVLREFKFITDVEYVKGVVNG